MKTQNMADKKKLTEIGVVASGSKPQNMRFYSMRQIEADCVVVELDGEKIVYEIIDVNAYNSRMEDMELVRYILPGEDYTKYNVYIANAKPLGMIKGDEAFSVKRWAVAPPGKIVREADSQEIALIYNVEYREEKQRIGHMLRHEQIPVWLDIPRLLTTHMALVGRSGQGKSNLAKILLTHLPMKYMVFTKVNEYTNIQNAKQIDAEHASANMNLSVLRKIFELNNSEVQYLKDYLKNTTHSQKVHTYELAEGIRQFFGSVPKGNFQQLDMFEEIVPERNIQLPKFAESLCNKIESISMDILMDKDLQESSESYIVNMQKLSDKEGEILLYACLAPVLENRSKSYKNTEQPIPLNERIVIFIEEAHNYVPSTRSAFCKDLIRSIAREGRKLGIHLVLLSQRPRHIDPTALSQCGSVISFNLTNPEDIDYLMQNANFYGDYYRNTINELKIGECTIVSDYLKKALNCKVDLK